MRYLQHDRQQETRDSKFTHESSNISQGTGNGYGIVHRLVPDTRPQHELGKADSRGTRIYKEHRNSQRRIDLAVAAVMALDRAAWHAGDTYSVLDSVR